MDPDTAWSNGAFIPNGAAYPALWADRAARFRAAHPPAALRTGASARQVCDLFRPDGPSVGTVVFVHGGYWREGDPALWSHLAAGSLARGWAVAIPGYDLCPDMTLDAITRQIAQALSRVAGADPGPLVLAGHSAGGHLVARMGCADVDLPCRDRIVRIVPISPVADLAPLMATAMNADLRIDAVLALLESPSRRPAPAAPVRVWVGADERPVFLAQARLLADRWSCPLTIEPNRHHFDVIEGLEHADSPLMRALLE